MPNPGDTAPDFTLARDGGGEITLSALRGQKVILFFYPQDDTPTCTNEALDFSAHTGDFAATAAVVIGISRDSVKSHDKFVKKHGLGMALAADESGEVCEAYGVWQEKTTFGKTYMGIVRTTFLIDAQGKIAESWVVTRVKGHAEAVLAAAQAFA